MFDADITLDDKAVQRYINKIGRELPKEAYTAVKETIKSALKQTKAATPRDTGKTKKAWTKSTRKKRLSGVVTPRKKSRVAELNKKYADTVYSHEYGRKAGVSKKGRRYPAMSASPFLPPVAKNTESEFMKQLSKAVDNAIK